MQKDASSSHLRVDETGMQTQMRCSLTQLQECHLLSGEYACAHGETALLWISVLDPVKLLVLFRSEALIVSSYATHIQALFPLEY